MPPIVIGAVVLMGWLLEPDLPAGGDSEITIAHCVTRRRPLCCGTPKCDEQRVGIENEPV